MPRDEAGHGLRHPRLHLDEGLPVREPEAARVALDDVPLGPPGGLLEAETREAPDVELEEAPLDADGQMASASDALRRLPRALERGRVESPDPGQLGDPLRHPLGLPPAILGQMEPGGTPGEHAAG